MIAYIDSSVFLRILLNQRGRLKEFDAVTKPISSLLMKTECLRTLDRLKLIGHLVEIDYITATEEFYRACASIEFIKISMSILNRAGSSFPVALGTLDAIHLSSAIAWAERTENPLVFMTHDKQLSHAAMASGFSVLGGPNNCPEN